MAPSVAVFETALASLKTSIDNLPDNAPAGSSDADASFDRVGGRDSDRAPSWKLLSSALNLAFKDVGMISDEQMLRGPKGIVRVWDLFNRIGAAGLAGARSEEEAMEAYVRITLLKAAVDRKASNFNPPRQGGTVAAEKNDGPAAIAPADATAALGSAQRVHSPAAIRTDERNATPGPSNINKRAQRAPSASPAPISDHQPLLSQKRLAAPEDSIMSPPSSDNETEVEARAAKRAKSELVRENQEADGNEDEIRGGDDAEDLAPVAGIPLICRVFAPWEEDDGTYLYSGSITSYVGDLADIAFDDAIPERVQIEFVHLRRCELEDLDEVDFMSPSSGVDEFNSNGQVSGSPGVLESGKSTITVKVTDDRFGVDPTVTEEVVAISKVRIRGKSGSGFAAFRKIKLLPSLIEEIKKVVNVGEAVDSEVEGSDELDE